MLPLFLAMLALSAAFAPVDVPMQLTNDHVFVDVWLDGDGPFHFIVDSGASNLMDPAVAARIGARVSGHVRIVGVGAAAVSAGQTTVRAVRIGGATFADERFVVTASHAALSAVEGRSVDGLIGRPIIADGVTIFDYAHRVLRLHADADEVVGNGATVLPVSYADGLPQVPCVLRGVAGACTVDTGSRLAASILAPFAQRYPSVVPPSLSAPGIDGYGIGGPAYGRLGRLERLAFGPIGLTDIPTDFSSQTRGAFADRRTAANIGGGVWRRFTLTFDLAHARISLRANDDFYEPYAVDRAGLFLSAARAGVTVLDVRPGTPAAQAGIAIDDVIVAVDGRRTATATLSDLRAAFRQPAGTLVRLDIARADRPARALSLRLADYF